MTDEIRPDRLDELFDGHAAAETDAERDLLHLAAELRAAAPTAPDHLRERIAELGEPDVTRRSTGGWLSRIRWRVLAPTMAAVIVVLVAVTVIPQVTDSPDGNVSLSDLASDSAPSAPADGDRSKDAPAPNSAMPVPPQDQTGGLGRGEAMEPAPTTATPVVLDGVVQDISLDRAQSAVVTAITLAGGNVIARTDDGATRSVTASLTRADAAALVDELTAIEGVTFVRRDLEQAVGARSTVRVDLRAP